MLRATFWPIQSAWPLGWSERFVFFCVLEAWNMPTYPFLLFARQQANSDVNQSVIVLSDDSEKWGWLVARLKKFEELGNVLIFVGMKNSVEELSENLNRFGFASLFIFPSPFLLPSPPFLLPFVLSSFPFLLLSSFPPFLLPLVLSSFRPFLLSSFLLPSLLFYCFASFLRKTPFLCFRFHWVLLLYFASFPSLPPSIYFSSCCFYSFPFIFISLALLSFYV